MSTSQLIRWSGLSLMLGGIALAIESVTHPPGETARYALEPVWGFAHWLGAFAWLLILFGLIGLYARQAQRIGRLGFVGFVMAVGGCRPVRGNADDRGCRAAADDRGEGAPAAGSGRTVFHFSGVQGRGWPDFGWVIGLLLLAIATLRARILPSIGSWVVILLVPAAVAAVPLVLFVAPGLQGILNTLLSIPIGAGLLAWGYALWRDPADTGGHSAGTQ